MNDEPPSTVTGIVLPARKAKASVPAKPADVSSGELVIDCDEEETDLGAKRVLRSSVKREAPKMTISKKSPSSDSQEPLVSKEFNFDKVFGKVSSNSEVNYLKILQTHKQQDLFKPDAFEEHTTEIIKNIKESRYSESCVFPINSQFCYLTYRFLVTFCVLFRTRETR